MTPEQRYSTQLDQSFLLMIFEKNFFFLTFSTFLAVFLAEVTVLFPLFSDRCG